MSESGVGTDRIAVVGANASDIAEAARGAGRTVEATDPSDLTTDKPDLVIAREEDAAIELARDGCEPPVLTVDAGPGLRSVSATAVTEAVGAIEDGSASLETHSILDVAVGGRSVARCLLDAVVSTEPARISAFAVRARDEPIDRVRCDGVVLATPAGAPGYANRVGCPLLDPKLECVAIAPIAPFRTDPDHWVVAADGVEVRPTRDESPVELQVDGRAVAEVEPDEPVSFAVVDRLDLVCVPSNVSPVAGGARESEKH